MNREEEKTFPFFFLSLIHSFIHSFTLFPSSRLPGRPRRVSDGGSVHRSDRDAVRTQPPDAGVRRVLSHPSIHPIHSILFYSIQSSIRFILILILILFFLLFTITDKYSFSSSPHHSS